MATGLIWVALVAAVITGATLSSAGHSAPVSSQVVATASGSGQSASAGQPVGTVGVNSIKDYSDPAAPDGKPFTHDTAADLLPAFRWSDTPLDSDLGFSDGADGIVDGLASLLFSLASVCWYILLQLQKFTLNLDLTSKMAGGVDKGFAELTHTLQVSGIIWVIFAFGLFGMAAMLLRGRNTRTMGLVIGMIVPIAAMFALANGAQGAANLKPGQTYKPPTGSPSWLAGKGVGFVDTIGATLGTGFGAGQGLTSVSADLTGGQGNCTQYTGALNQAYKVALNNNGSGKGTPSPTSFASSDQGLETISDLWQRGYLSLWDDAQFSAQPGGSSRMACHYLEDANKYPGNAQQQVGNVAYGSSNNGEGKYDHYDDTLERHAGFFMWGACTPTSVINGWDVKIQTSDCKTWWGESANNANNDTSALQIHGDDLSSLTTDASGTAAQKAVHQQTHDIINSFWGHNSATRLLDSVLACVTAGIYIYALGGLAIGSLIAQVGLIIMLMLFPATLLLLAIPRKGDGKKHPAGMKFLKLTGGFFAARLVLILVDNLLLTFIVLLEGLSGSTFGDSAIMHSLVPLAAIFLLRQLLKMTGLGDITSLSGSLGMSSAVAAQAGGMKNSFDNSFRGIRKGLDGADGAIKKRAKGVGGWMGKKAANGAGALGKKAGQLGKKAGTYLGDQAQLQQRRQVWFSHTTPDGERVNGRLRQFASIAGLAEVARGAGTTDVNGTRVNKDGRTAAAARKLDSLLNGKGLLARWAHHDAEAQTRAANAEASLAARKAAVVPGGWKMSGAQREEKRLTQINDAYGRVSDSDMEARRAWAAEQGLPAPDGTKVTLATPLEQLRVSEPIARTEAASLSEKYNVDAQQVVWANHGLTPVVAPVGRVAGTRLKINIGKNADVDAFKMALTDPLTYAPKEEVQRREGETEMAYHTRLATLRDAKGGTVDLARFGIDLSRAEGKAELRKLQNGEASKFDQIVLRTHFRELAAIDNYARKAVANMPSRAAARQELMDVYGQRSQELGKARAEQFQGDSPQAQAMRQVESTFQSLVRDSRKLDATAQGVHQKEAERTALSDKLNQLTAQAASGMDVRAELERGEKRKSKVDAELEAARTTLAGLQAQTAAQVKVLQDQKHAVSNHLRTELPSVVADSTDLGAQLDIYSKNKDATKASLEAQQRIDRSAQEGASQAKEMLKLMAKLEHIVAADAGNSQALVDAASQAGDLFTNARQTAQDSAKKVEKETETVLASLAQDGQRQEAAQKRWSAAPGADVVDLATFVS